MTKIVEDKFTGPMAWDAETVFSNGGLSVLNDACRAEIEAAERVLRDNPLSVEALRPEGFEMPACRVLMAEVCEAIDHGTGFTVIDRLDIDILGREGGIRIYWLLMSMVRRPVAQQRGGTLLYDVRDTGVSVLPGSSVRSSRTSGAARFHNDNSCDLPPDFVSLLCLQPAKQGGVSGLVSFESVHNRMLEEHRDVLQRLYQPYYFDRLKEHAPGDKPFSFKPIFEAHGDVLNVNYAPGLVELGYLNRGEKMDGKARAAFDALCRITDSGDLRQRHVFQRGQIQVVNNRRLAHCRTAFVDCDEPARKRHLVRLWLRKSGRPSYQG